MVGTLRLDIEGGGGPRWEAGLELLSLGDGAIGLSGLTVSCDPPREGSLRRMRVQVECIHDPLSLGEADRARLEPLANRELDQARALIQEACAGDARFAVLVANSELLYEYVYSYGMGSLLLAMARANGPFTWE